MVNDTLKTGADPAQTLSLPFTTVNSAGEVVQPEPLAQLLWQRGVLNRSQLTYALQKQRISEEPLDELLIRLGLIAERDLAEGLAELHSLRYCPPEDLPEPEPEVRKLFRRELCLSHSMCPIRIREGVLTVLIGLADPQRVMALIDRRTGLGVDLLQSEPSVVARAINRLWDDEAVALEKAFLREYEKLRIDSQNTLSTNTLLSKILHFAVAERATDIHLHPEARSIHLSFRIDGVMLPVFCMEPSLGRLSSAIKVLAGMDIADNLLPQDGRFSTTVNDSNFDVRVSTSVTPAGESVVLRLLPTGAYINGLGELGILPQHLPIFSELFAEPYGIVLMTGPTGSGKTTTLYAGLRSQGLTGKNILTVEDPIEYALPFAVQTQVNRRAGYRFNNAIASFLRHDPDIMLVGEIRDQETAEAAMRASETGHLVLSTLHANSVFSVVNRLEALGIRPNILAESLIGVVNQRLARKLCLYCREPETLDTGETEPIVYRAVGCPRCRGTGYHGRVLVYELLTVNTAIADWISQGAPRRVAESIANQSGQYVAMHEVAQHRLLSGETSHAELQRLFGNQMAIDTVRGVGAT